MLLRLLRFAAVIVTALGLTLGVAHTLELPVKIHYDAQLYLTVTSTLYRMYGSVGAIFQMGALILVAVLCWQVRGRRGFGLTLAALVCLIVSLGLWVALVQPVN